MHNLKYAKAVFLMCLHLYYIIVEMKDKALKMYVQNLFLQSIIQKWKKFKNIVHI